MKAICAVVAAVMLTLAVDLSRADENGFYFGGAAGRSQTRDKRGPGNIVDDTDLGFKILGGWRPVDWFAVEGTYYDLGDVALERNVPDLSPFALEQTAYGGYGVFLLDIARFDLFGKVGLIRSKADYTSNTLIGPVTWTDRDTDYAWGLGAQAHFGRAAARIEYERLHISNGPDFKSPKLVFVGMTWRFTGD
jgi:hypothetical protein